MSPKMSSFYFTKVPPEEQMYTDIKSLNKFEEKAFCQLVDIVFSFLVSPKEGARFMSQISDFAAEQGLSPNALKNVVKSLLSFFKSALKSNLTPGQVKEDVEHLGKNMQMHLHHCLLALDGWGKGRQIEWGRGKGGGGVGKPRRKWWEDFGKCYNGAWDVVHNFPDFSKVTRSRKKGVGTIVEEGWGVDIAKRYQRWESFSLTIKDEYFGWHRHKIQFVHIYFWNNATLSTRTK